MKRTRVWSGVIATVMATALHVSAADLTVTTVNNQNPPAGQTSLAQALASAQAGDTIKFNIAGDGPHVIVTPMGGYPLITVDNVTLDGYSQPGSKPNSNGILGGSNADIRIVLDSTDPAEGANAANPELPLRRSTRLPYSGYGDSENAILGVLAADGFKVRGVAFLGRHTDGSDADPAIYAVALVQEALNAKVQGCWFGLKPGDEPIQENLKPCSSAVAAFRHREPTDTYSGGLVVGTDGDGTKDVEEFNVILGCHIALALEAPDLRVSGNYVNVFPNGTTFVDVDMIYNDLMATGRGSGDSSVEFLENGRVAHNTVIGTNGDGKSDGNERNVVAHTVYDAHFEFYSAATNTVIAGNYFGVGVDGVTAAPIPVNATPNFVSLPGTADARIGSNGDGVSDNLEGNLIVKVPGTRLADSGVAVPLTVRRNLYVENAFNGFPFADGENASYELYYANALVDSTLGAVPTIDSITAGIMKGTLPAPNTANYAKHVVDVYVMDTKTAEQGRFLPAAYAGSFVEGSAADQNASANAFTVDLKGMSIKPGDQVAIAVTYTQADKGTPGTNSITGPLSAPLVADIPVVVPGSIESVGLTRIVSDTAIVVPNNDALGNWEPYASVLGTNVFLVEANTFAKDFDMPSPDGKQRFVVALQPADGKAGKVVEGFYSDAGAPYDGAINGSRQNGNPGRVAGDKRPGAVNYIVGGEASPHSVTEFQSDSRWAVNGIYSADNRYATVQTFALDPATLTPTPLTKAFDAVTGRNTGAFSGNVPEVSRFGGDVVCLDNGNFVVVIDDRSNLIAPVRTPTLAIITPQGQVVKESFAIKPEVSDQIWANVVAFRGGFAARFQGVIHLYDNAGTPLGQIDQNTSGETFDRGRGDGVRIAAHINSPYVYLAGQASTTALMKLVAWDTRDRSFVASAEVSEPAFAGGFDRANLAVDALNRITVAWVSKPEGYEQQQAAARVLALDEATKTITPLTKSFLPFINAAQSGGIRSLQMSVAMTTRQICVAAKGEINLQNKPDQGATTNPNTGEPLKEINFYTVFTHPNPQDDPTTPVGGGAVPQFTSIKRNANGTVTVEWTGGGTLEAAPTITGPWVAITGATSPYTVTPDQPQTFARIKK